MKKRFCLLLVMALCLAGCSTPEPAEAEAGFTFTYQEITIAMKAEAAPLIAALGEPKSCTEETSCAFAGLDKTYYYGSFYLTTYPQDGKDYIYSLWFADDSVATDEGIRIGTSRAAVEQAYGAASFNGSNAYLLTRGESRLTILLTGEVVSSIQYTSVFE